MEKMIMLSVIVLVLMIGAQSAFAQAPDNAKYIYGLGYKVGYNDGVTEGIYHHIYDDIKNTSWSRGYLNGFSDGCVHTGRTADDCDSQADANTP